MIIYFKTSGSKHGNKRVVEINKSETNNNVQYMIIHENKFQNCLFNDWFEAIH